MLLLLGNGTGSAHIWWIKRPHKILPCRSTQSDCLCGMLWPWFCRMQRPSLSFSVAAKIFVLALFGTTIHLNVYYAGLAYTSPTVACALSNVIPSLTFLMAVLLGLEKLKIRTARGQAKLAGTLFGIGGSLVFTFWKGGYLFKGKLDQRGPSYSDESHCVECMANPPGCGLQSLHCLIIVNHDDMLFRIVAIFFSCSVFRKKSNFMETGVEPATFNDRLLQRLHFGSGGVQLDRSVSHYRGPLLCLVGKEGKTILLLNRQRMEKGYLKTLKCWRMIFQS
ncbi:unnamed protein product [Prunus brigantina]